MVLVLPVRGPRAGLRTAQAVQGSGAPGTCSAPRQPSAIDWYTARSLASLTGLSMWPQASFLNRLSSRNASLPARARALAKGRAAHASAVHYLHARRPCRHTRRLYERACPVGSRTWQAAASSRRACSQGGLAGFAA